MADNKVQLTGKQRAEKLKTVMASDSVQEQFKNALKDNAGPFIASVIDLYNSDTYLQNCDPQQVVMEALKAATLKLPINKNLGFAYVVPYKKNGVQIPQMQIGYKGYVQLAMRTGQYKYINTDVVFEGEFKGRDKLSGRLDFSGDKKSDKIIGYVAYIETLNGFSKALYMTVDDVKRHAQRYSKSYQNGNEIWKNEFDAMAKKTVLRNLLTHYGFLSVEMTSAFTSDEPESYEREVERGIDNNAATVDVGFEEVKEEQQKGSEKVEEEPVKPPFD